MCGPIAFKEVESERLLVALSDSGHHSDPPAAGSPWYRADVTFQGGEQEERVSFVVVPGEQELRAEDGTWMSMLPQHVEEYEAMVSGLDPFPASELAGVDPSVAPTAPEPAAPDDGGAVSLTAESPAECSRCCWPRGGLLALRRRRQAGSGAAGLRTSSAGAGRPT